MTQDEIELREDFTRILNDAPQTREADPGEVQRALNSIRKSDHKTIEYLGRNPWDRYHEEHGYTPEETQWLKEQGLKDG